MTLSCYIRLRLESREVELRCSLRSLGIRFRCFPPEGPLLRGSPTRLGSGYVRESSVSARREAVSLRTSYSRPATLWPGGAAWPPTSPAAVGSSGPLWVLQARPDGWRWRSPSCREKHRDSDHTPAPAVCYCKDTKQNAEKTSWSHSRGEICVGKPNRKGSKSGKMDCLKKKVEFNCRKTFAAL